MAVEASRLALRSVPEARPRTALFATANPTYLEKTNAAVLHAALRLDQSAIALDVGGAVRSGLGALRLALEGAGTTLVASADIRVGLANSPDESSGGDGAAAFLIGDSEELFATYLGGASATREFLDRWRSPGEVRTKQWEERFGENHYVALGLAAWAETLEQLNLTANQITTVLVAGPHGRANNSLAKKLGVTVAPNLADSLGNLGAADGCVQLVGALEAASAGDTIALIGLADGADVLVFERGSAPAVPRSLAAQIAGGNAALPYAKYLAWRGIMAPNPPNRPEPARASAAAAGRSGDWKFGFVASKDRESGAVHMPPARVSFEGGNVDDMEPLPMADAVGTVMTFTVDRLAYSQSPPVIFAVVDFEGGGRLPVEVCDVVPDGIQVGDSVEMTFRRLNSADGISNYFWKATPIRGSR